MLKQVLALETSFLLYSVSKKLYKEEVITALLWPLCKEREFTYTTFTCLWYNVAGDQTRNLWHLTQMLYKCGVKVVIRNKFLHIEVFNPNSVVQCIIG